MVCAAVDRFALLSVEAAGSSLSTDAAVLTHRTTADGLTRTALTRTAFLTAAASSIIHRALLSHRRRVLSMSVLP